VNRFFLCAALGGAALGPCQAQNDTQTSIDQKMMPGMAGMMSMSSSTDLNDPMSQEASGTAWLPASSPMYGKMFMRRNGDMLMIHGAAMPRYTDVGSKRGDRRIDAPNWIMGMYAHPLGPKDQIGLRGMFSLDPITEGGYGYPLLYQTGETWHHEPLHDRQHPHDLVDELAVSYSHLMGGGRSTYLYLGYPGEPALGPPTYMHRLLAYDLADAPLGHHWQDATHVTFGAATAGINFGSKLKFEASDFTGREPDENRYSFDKPRFDSYSGRFSYNPDADDAFQVSYGFIENAEGDGVNQHRITASWLYDKPLVGDSNFTTALVWGQNNLATEGRTNSYLAEADYQRGRNTVFGRYENITKSGHELVLPTALEDGKYNLNALTAGYIRDVTHGTGIDTGIGAAVTLDTHPSSLNSVYGGGTPLGFEVFVRFRPSRLKMDSMKMGQGDGMKMVTPTPSPAPMPGMDMPMTPSPATPTPPAPTPHPTPTPAVSPATPSSLANITATLAPAPPHAQQSATLTVTLINADGSPSVGATVTADVAMATMDMGTSHPTFTDQGGGHYAASVMFAMSGPWRVTLHVTSHDGSKLTKTLDYAVGR
jgi:hypothetical protein